MTGGKTLVSMGRVKHKIETFDYMGKGVPFTDCGRVMLDYMSAGAVDNMRASPRDCKLCYYEPRLRRAKKS